MAATPLPLPSALTGMPEWKAAVETYEVSVAAARELSSASGVGFLGMGSNNPVRVLGEHSLAELEANYANVMKSIPPTMEGYMNYGGNYSRNGDKDKLSKFTLFGSIPFHSSMTPLGEMKKRPTQASLIAPSSATKENEKTKKHHLAHYRSGGEYLATTFEAKTAKAGFTVHTLDSKLRESRYFDEADGGTMEMAEHLSRGSFAVLKLLCLAETWFFVAHNEAEVRKFYGDDDPSIDKLALVVGLQQQETVDFTDGEVVSKIAAALLTRTKRSKDHPCLMPWTSIKDERGNVMLDGGGITATTSIFHSHNNVEEVNTAWDMLNAAHKQDIFDAISADKKNTVPENKRPATPDDVDLSYFDHLWEQGVASARAAKIMPPLPGSWNAVKLTLPDGSPVMMPGKKGPRSPNIVEWYRLWDKVLPYGGTVAVATVSFNRSKGRIFANPVALAPIITAPVAYKLGAEWEIKKGTPKDATYKVEHFLPTVNPKRALSQGLGGNQKEVVANALAVVNDSDDEEAMIEAIEARGEKRSYSEMADNHAQATQSP